MKYIIKFEFDQEGEIQKGEFVVGAEDARYAIKMVENELCILAAKVISVTPIEN